jgi:hypothetical protein
MGEWRYNSTIITLGIRWGRVISITRRSLYTRHPLGGAESRSGLVDKIQMSCPCKESQPDSSVIGVIGMLAVHIVGKHAHTCIIIATHTRQAFEVHEISNQPLGGRELWFVYMLPSIEVVHELSSTYNKQGNSISTTRWQKIIVNTYLANFKIKKAYI